MIVQLFRALFRVRDVPGSSPVCDTYLYIVNFIFFLSCFLFQIESIFKIFFHFVTYPTFFKVFTKNSIHDIFIPFLHLITDYVNFVTSIS